MSGEDEPIVRLGFASPGLLAEVSVTYRAWIQDRWIEVARYDNAHGLAHRHRFWADPATSALRRAMKPAQLLDFAEAEPKQNWPTYRRRMEGHQL